MQDQPNKVHQECKVHDEVQEAVQEGQKEEEAVPEDLLRARLRRLNGRTLGGSRCGHSAARSQLSSSDMGASVKTIAKETLPDPRKLGCAHEGPTRGRQEAEWGWDRGDNA